MYIRVNKSVHDKEKELILVAYGFNFQGKFNDSKKCLVV